jgi:hypothetical protein
VLTAIWMIRRERANCYSWIGGDRPSDVLEQAKARKAQGFTAVKMNAVESVSDASLGFTAPAEHVSLARLARFSPRFGSYCSATQGRQVRRSRRRARFPRSSSQDLGQAIGGGTGTA